MERLWGDYLKKIKSSLSLPSYKGLTNVRIRLEKPFTLWFEVSSKAALEEFKQQQDKIARELKKELNNYSIKIKTDIVSVKEKNTLFSPEEKYVFLANKNKNLDRLRERLGLDIYE